jgi:hypothetical protein
MKKNNPMIANQMKNLMILGVRKIIEYKNEISTTATVPYATMSKVFIIGSKLYKYLKD